MQRNELEGRQRNYRRTVAEDRVSVTLSWKHAASTFSRSPLGPKRFSDVKFLSFTRRKHDHLTVLLPLLGLKLLRLNWSDFRVFAAKRSLRRRPDCSEETKRMVTICSASQPNPKRRFVSHISADPRRQGPTVHICPAKTSALCQCHSEIYPSPHQTWFHWRSVKL